MRTRGKASGAAAGRNCHSFPQTRAASPPLIIITPQRGGHLEMKVARFPSGAFKVTRGWVQRLTSRKIVTDPPGSVYPQASSGAAAGSKAP